MNLSQKLRNIANKDVTFGMRGHLRVSIAILTPLLIICYIGLIVGFWYFFTGEKTTHSYFNLLVCVMILYGTISFTRYLIFQIKIYRSISKTGAGEPSPGLNFPPTDWKWTAQKIRGVKNFLCTVWLLFVAFSVFLIYQILWDHGLSFEWPKLIAFFLILASMTWITILAVKERKKLMKLGKSIQTTHKESQRP